MWVSVSGTGGTLYFEVGKPWIRMDDGTSEQVIDLEGDHYGLVPMAREFRDSIREGREPETPGAVGLLDLMLVLKAYESIDKGTSQAIS
jgi:predicted dehydrogenase